MQTTKTIAAAAAGLATLALLAGCATSMPHKATPNGGTDSTAKAAAQTEPQPIYVAVTKVIDPVTLKVKPSEGAAKGFIVDVNDIEAPTQGQCGYDQAMLHAKRYLDGKTFQLGYSHNDDGVYIGKDGHHHASLTTGHGLDSYGNEMLREGLATIPDRPDETGFSDDRQAGARDAKIGLWASCPDFGKDAPEHSYRKALPASAFTEELKKDEGRATVNVESMADTTHWTVVPDELSARNGYRGKATVTLDPETKYVTPLKGECGYDEALAFAQSWFADEANTNDFYVSYGYMQASRYFTDAARKGLAYATDPRMTGVVDASAQPKHDRTGLWGSCPGFGANAAQSSYDY